MLNRVTTTNITLTLHPEQRLMTNNDDPEASEHKPEGDTKFFESQAYQDKKFCGYEFGNIVQGDTAP